MSSDATTLAIASKFQTRMRLLLEVYINGGQSNIVTINDNEYYVAKSTIENAGFGLFTVKDMEKGTILIKAENPEERMRQFGDIMLFRGEDTFKSTPKVVLPDAESQKTYMDNVYEVESQVFINEEWKKDASQWNEYVKNQIGMSESMKNQIEQKAEVNHPYAISSRILRGYNTNGEMYLYTKFYNPFNKLWGFINNSTADFNLKFERGKGDSEDLNYFFPTQLTASKNIPAGSELFFDYGDRYDFGDIDETESEIDVDATESEIDVDATESEIDVDATESEIDVDATESEINEPSDTLSVDIADQDTIEPPEPQKPVIPPGVEINEDESDSEEEQGELKSNDEEEYKEEEQEEDTLFTMLSDQIVNHTSESDFQGKKNIYIFACVNDNPLALIPDVSIYGYCAYAMYFLPGRHYMVVCDSRATHKKIYKAAKQWSKKVKRDYNLEENPLGNHDQRFKFKNWLERHILLENYVENVDNLKNCVQIDEDECLSFLYLAGHGDESGRLYMPGGEVLTDTQLLDIATNMGKIRNQNKLCRAKDFKIMLNGDYLGNRTALLLTRILYETVVLASTRSFVTGTLLHDFKIYKGRLFFSAKLIVTGENRLYAYLNKKVANTVLVQGARAIKKREFYSNDLIERVELLSVLEIGSEAFAGCTRLKTVLMPRVKNIGTAAFVVCDELEEVDMPMVEVVGKEAFADCIKLKTVVMPRVIEIASKAFAGCTRLKTVLMPRVKNIGTAAFVVCDELEEVDMPMVEVVGKEAFADCIKLKTVVMPRVIEIASKAFAGCVQLNINLENMPNLRYLAADAFPRKTREKRESLYSGTSRDSKRARRLFQVKLRF